MVTVQQVAREHADHSLSVGPIPPDDLQVAPRKTSIDSLGIRLKFLPALHVITLVLTIAVMSTHASRAGFLSLSVM